MNPSLTSSGRAGNRTGCHTPGEQDKKANTGLCLEAPFEVQLVRHNNPVKTDDSVQRLQLIDRSCPDESYIRWTLVFL